MFSPSSPLYCVSCLAFFSSILMPLFLLLYKQLAPPLFAFPIFHTNICGLLFCVSFCFSHHLIIFPYFYLSLSISPFFNFYICITTARSTSIHHCVSICFSTKHVCFPLTPTRVLVFIFLLFSYNLQHL